MNVAPSKIREWREHPDIFVREVFGVTPDGWQDEVLRDFPHYQRLAMKACKGPGKSAVLAWVAWNFLLTRPHPKIAATSVTEKNLLDGLWSEMAKWQKKSKLLQSLFTWQKTRIYSNEHPETWWMSARTWSKSADSQTQGETLAGLHADYLMFVLDESGGIPEAIMVAAEAGLSTGIECKIIQAGNPTHLDGPLWNATKRDREQWKLYEITGDPDDPNRSSRIDIKWARDEIKKHGLDNPWVMVNVLGKFPPGSINALITEDEVRESMERFIKVEDYNFMGKRMGVDVARFGDDATVLMPRQGRRCFKPVVMRNAKTHEIASRVAAGREKWADKDQIYAEIFVDATGGYGAGVEDSLEQSELSCVPVMFNGKADDERYANKRCEMWFRAVKWVQTGGVLPYDPDLIKELTGTTYMFVGGKFWVESKDQMKQRVGYSPDKTDALILTFAHAEAGLVKPDLSNPNALKMILAQQRGGQSDWDPLQDRDDW